LWRFYGTSDARDGETPAAAATPRRCLSRACGLEQIAVMADASAASPYDALQIAAFRMITCCDAGHCDHHHAPA
jgi:hypothetical protein